MDAESQLLAEKDAEIWRLRADCQIVRNSLDYADAKLLGYEKLITELCDALEPLCWTAQAQALIQRGREATR